MGGRRNRRDRRAKDGGVPGLDGTGDPTAGLRYGLTGLDLVATAMITVATATATSTATSRQSTLIVLLMVLPSAPGAPDEEVEARGASAGP